MGIPQTGSASQAPIARFYSATAWVEGRAEHQLGEVAGWPGMRAVAALPDLHPGRHGPVGAAFLADRIYPQLVGPDIGCGMALFRLDLPRRKLKLDKAARRMAVLDQPLEDAQARLVEAGVDGPTHGMGTIGGGNHFCEVQVVTETFAREAAGLGLGRDVLCLLVHSGSRSMGTSIFEGLEASWTSGFAPESDDARTYLALHDRAVAWARLNRLVVAERAAAALRAGLTPVCDAVHNLVVPHHGHWLHRKGAAAPDGGLAPLAGSREHLSYLLAIEDRADALHSVSHGAGRRYDRSSMHGRVRRVRSELEALKRNRFGGQVICEDRDLMIEEAGAAYKDPAEVLADLQTHGIARPIAAMAPLLTFKTAGGRG